MAEGQVVKCLIGGKPYIFMPYYAGNQTACPKCVKDAEDNTCGKWVKM